MKTQAITIKTSILLLLISLTVLFCLSSVSAADNDTIFVATNGSDANDGFSWNTAKLSIKNAIGTVNTNGTIHIADGTYTGPDNRGIIIDKNMTIVGQSQTGTIIDAEKQGRIFTINSGRSVTLQNLTLQNGTTTGFGGAIYNYGNLTVTECTFIGNTANSGLGGAILNDDSTGFILKDSTFINNAAGNGGAIANWGDNAGSYTVNIENCTFTNNNAQQIGGAIFNWNIYGSITINITKSTFTGNNANLGGAIYNGQYLNAHYNRFYNNTAHYGSAIFNVFGTVDAENNWWGTNNPDWSSLIYQFSAPNWWIYMNLTANTTNPLYGDTVNLTANFNYLYNGTSVIPLIGGYIPGSVVSFASNEGSLNPLSKTTMDGLASSIFTPTKASGTVYATLDGETCSLTFNVDKAPTNLTIDSLSGNKGKTVTLKAILTDYYGTLLNNKIVEFYVNNVKIGENSTDANGLAILDYNITQIGGTYDITAKFLGDGRYLASTGNGTLKVNQSSIYVNITASKNNPKVGETFTLTYKLGNYGPDPAENVKITMSLPEGFEIGEIHGDGNWTYNAATNTITWTFENVPVGDPYLYVSGLLNHAGTFVFSSLITSDTYTITTEGTPITINAVAEVNAASNTVGMQETGTPINYLILAILMVISGLLVPKRK